MIRGKLRYGGCKLHRRPSRDLSLQPVVTVHTDPICRWNELSMSMLGLVLIMTRFTARRCRLDASMRRFRMTLETPFIHWPLVLGMAIRPA